jgi:uncharacterized membrane protein YfhO
MGRFLYLIWIFVFWMFFYLIAEYISTTLSVCLFCLLIFFCIIGASKIEVIPMLNKFRFKNKKAMTADIPIHSFQEHRHEQTDKNSFEFRKWRARRNDIRFVKVVAIVVVVIFIIMKYQKYQINEAEKSLIQRSRPR